MPRYLLMIDSITYELPLSSLDGPSEVPLCSMHDKLNSIFDGQTLVPSTYQCGKNGYHDATAYPTCPSVQDDIAHRKKSIHKTLAESSATTSTGGVVPSVKKRHLAPHCRLHVGTQRDGHTTIQANDFWVVGILGTNVQSCFDVPIGGVRWGKFWARKRSLPAG